MESVSRGDWSRASGELCKAAAKEVLQKLHEFDASHNDHDHDHQDVAVEESAGAAVKSSSSFITPLLLSKTETPSDDNGLLVVGYGGCTDNEQLIAIATGKKQQPAHTTRQQRRRSSMKAGLDEGKAMIQLAIPVIVTYLFEMLPGIVSIILVGHIDSTKSKEYLDAAALAVMFTNLTALSVGIGLVSAMDTLCSQAYGAGELNTKALTYVTTGLYVCCIAFIFILIININAATILKALGQPVEIAELAGVFVWYLLPGIPCLYVYELLRKVLQAQNIALPMLYVAILANIINCTLGYYLVFGLDNDSTSTSSSSFLGPDNWLGAAIARTAGNISLPIFLIIYLYVSGHYHIFQLQQQQQQQQYPDIRDQGSRYDHSFWKLQKDAWKGISQFIELGIPGALQLCFEWWAFECLALISGLLPDAVIAIGSNAILLNIASMVYMFYLGVSIATNVRIGNALGAGLPNRASLAANLGLGLGILCSILCATLLLVFREELPGYFTNDPEIDAYTSELLIIAATFQLPDSINGTIQGIFRGSGRQTLGATLNFVAYYVVGIPIGVLLAFYFNQGLWGLWVGMTIGLLVVGTIGLYIVYTSKWKQLADDAIRRIQ